MPAFVRVELCIVPVKGLRCVMTEQDPADDSSAFFVLHYKDEKDPVKIRIMSDGPSVDATLDALLAVMNEAPESALGAQMSTLSLNPQPVWAFNHSKDEKKTPAQPIATWHNRA
jgi:hypothetical protein